MNQNWALLKSWRVEFSFYLEQIIEIKTLNFTSFYWRRCWKCPSLASRQSFALFTTLAATRSMTELSYLAAKLFTQSIRLWMVSGCFLIHFLLRNPQKMKIQLIQIRGVSWPDDGRASTDHSVLELLNKKILCQTRAVRRGAILHPPVTFPRGLVSECWP